MGRSEKNPAGMKVIEDDRLKSHQSESQIDDLVDLLVDVLIGKSKDLPTDNSSPVLDGEMGADKTIETISHHSEARNGVKLEEKLSVDRDRPSEIPLVSSELIPEEEETVSHHSEARNGVKLEDKLSADRDRPSEIPLVSSELIPEHEELATETIRLIEIVQDEDELGKSVEKKTNGQRFVASEAIADLNVGNRHQISNDFAQKQPASDRPAAHSSDMEIEPATDVSDPFDALQDLLFGSKLSEFEELTKACIEKELPRLQEKMTSAEQKLQTVQDKLDDPDQIFQLLFPAITEILKREIAESQGDVISSIVPIIDEIIAGKKRQDKSGMINAIADLLPGAISQHIKNSPEEVAKALAPEIAIAIREQGKLDRNAIANVLAPEMGRAIKEQIRLERDAMVDALYPVIGNTISKYLTEAIQNINQKVSNAFSAEGISRKVRAKLHGVSEAELILQESIPFTIQAIFLIHTNSGLIISDVQTSGSYQLESEMVAGMLTAIRSFVNDCIAQPDDYSELNEIEYGASKILLEMAGYCYLAVIMKGEPTKKFIAKMRTTMGTIVLDYGEPIQNFDGDPETIPPAVNQLLEQLIEFPVKKLFSRTPMALIGLCASVALLALIPWGYFSYQNYLDHRIEKKAVRVLESSPELAIYQIDAKVEGDRLKLTGKLPNERLRYLAESLALSTAPGVPVDNQIIAVDIPPDPVATAGEVGRVTGLLNELTGISIQTSYGDRKVTIDGEVMAIEDAHKIAAAFEKIPGIQSVVSTLRINPIHIENRIYFDAGSTKLNPKDIAILAKIKDVLDRHPQLSLKIIGHTDQRGNATKNQQLALQRAIAVRDSLTRQGIDPNRLQVVGNAQPPADVASHQPFLLGRTVVFEIIDNPGEEPQ